MNDHDYCQIGRQKDRRRCCVPNCQCSRDSLMFHKFPQNRVLLEKWEDVLKLPERRNRTSYVCSDHFLKDDYVPSLRKIRILRPKAVPTQNLDLPAPKVKDYVVSMDDDLVSNEHRKVKLGVVPFVLDFLETPTKTIPKSQITELKISKSNKTSKSSEATRISPDIENTTKFEVDPLSETDLSSSESWIHHPTCLNHEVSTHQQINKKVDELVTIKEEKVSDEYEFEEEIEFNMDNLPNIKVEEISFSSQKNWTE